MAAGLVVAAVAGAALTPAQEAVAKAGPAQLRLMVAGFGTIESHTQIEKWLGEQLQPRRGVENPPTLADGEKISSPNFATDVVQLNWNTRKMEYMRSGEALAAENSSNERLLRSLRAKVLTDAATRYVPLAKSYLQASLFRRAGRLVQVVDRSNADMNMVEQALGEQQGGGNCASAVAGATCILTAALGDREEDVRIVTVNAKGTQVKTIAYTQPYVGKIRDLQGNVLLAFKGASRWSMTMNSVVKGDVVDPARKLVEAACDKIADEVVAFFVTTLNFKVKVPVDADEDEVTVMVDGKDVDVDNGVKVLAVEHAVVATLDGCKLVRRVVVIDENTPAKTVKLVFRKKTPDPASAADGE
jgi:hypothetical protein